MQMIAVFLSTLLFIKYIFFDKSETFSSSLPNTPVESRKNSALPPSSSVQHTPPQHAPTSTPPACPFTALHVANGTTRDSMARAAANLRRPGGLPAGLERLASEGLIIEEKETRSQLSIAAVELSKDESGGGMTGGMVVPSRSSGNLLQLVSSAEPVSKAVLDRAATDVESASIGIQTDLSRPNELIFSIGEEERRCSTQSAISSAEESSASVDSPPRDVDVCLAILKSDVS